MKKLILTAAALLLLAGTTFGQTLKKGGIIAITTWEVTLKPDATMNQFLDISKKWNSAYEKAYPGTKAFTLMGERGENKYKVSTLLYFESTELRDKFWPTEDEEGPYDEAASEFFAPIMEEGSKLIIDNKGESTDWLIL